MRRYSSLENEEVVLLRGLGCFWKKCRFCNYYLDSATAEEAVKEDFRVLNEITGDTGQLTVLNSGSYFELPVPVRDRIRETILEKKIKTLVIESHPFYLKKIRALRKDYEKLGVSLRVRVGIESFDENIRENLFKKGFGELSLSELREDFDECCLLFGVKGQSLETLKRDIELATENFSRVFLNIYEEREGLLPADPELINRFIRELYPELESRENLIILLNNTDLGVG